MLLVLLALAWPSAAGLPAVVPEEEQPVLPALTAGAQQQQQEEIQVPEAGRPMEDLLHWAVQHSDPEKLKEVIRKYQESNLTLKDVYGQDVLDALFVDEGSAMLDLVREVADFQNASVPDEDLEAALERLEEFVEQIDAAGNLHRMGGLAPLLDLGLSADRSPEVCAKALWVLGVATQNNPPVQEDLLGLGGLRQLAARLPRCGSAAAGGTAGRQADPLDGAPFCGKLLFAMSGLVKNNATIQAEASALGVFDWLLGPGTAHPALAVAKKSMGLLETVLAQSPDLPFLSAVGSDRQAMAADALLAHVRGATGAEESDIDPAEKALRLLGRLLALRPMLFPSGFQPRLSAAAAAANARCERAFGAGDELCTGLAGLAGHADIMLTARDISDEEL